MQLERLIQFSASDRTIILQSYDLSIHIGTSAFTALVFFREKNRRISIENFEALSNANRDSESSAPAFRDVSFYAYAMERINVTRANPRYTGATEKNDISRGISVFKCLEGDPRSVFNNPRDVIPRRAASRAYGGTGGGVSGGFHAAGGRRGWRGWREVRRAASEKRVSRPVTDGPRQT